MTTATDFPTLAASKYDYVIKSSTLREYDLAVAYWRAYRRGFCADKYAEQVRILHQYGLGSPEFVAMGG